MSPFLLNELIPFHIRLAMGKLTFATSGQILKVLNMFLSIFKMLIMSVFLVLASYLIFKTIKAKV